MSWGDNINIEQIIEDDDNINWKNRFEFVRKAINDLDYMLSKVASKKVGQVYVSLCPFPTHTEKTGSFTIYPSGYARSGQKPQDYSSFYCFGCGEGGDAIKFTQLLYELPSKKDACKKLEVEFNIDVDNDDIRQIMLKDGLNSVKNSQPQVLDFVKINRICSNICRQYLQWVKINHPNNLRTEFSIIQKYYKFFDKEMLDMTMNEALVLIDQTEKIIMDRKNQIITL